VKPLRWGITIVAATFVVVIVVGLGWLEVIHYSCHRRNEALERWVGSIARDAHEQLKIGTKKADVARFYTEHDIPFEVVSWPFKDGGFEALGTLYAEGGCSFSVFWGWRTADVIIRVNVKVDADGTVIGAPEVISGFEE
jgi:hypothetical protein